MVENSNIEWTTHTFNPWIGCQKVGPGCDNCYAEAWDARGLQKRESRWGAHADRTRTSAGNWSKPLAWNRAARACIAVGLERPRVFCASLADVFDNHPSIRPEWRADLWAMIRATPNLDWMLLTKRPGNIAGMLPPDWGQGYPNVWLGCTVVNREEMLRDGPKLKRVPARVRFWSVEPLLGDIGEIPCDLLPDLVIVGGESGPRARPMHPDHVRSLRDQCVAAGVSFFFKQWGEYRPPETPAELQDFKQGKGYNGSLMPDGTFGNRFGGGLVRVGKRAAGRFLDGRTWDQMPGGDHD